MERGTSVADRFEVDGPPLGRGATGEVWPAVDRVTGREVAVKILHPELVDDELTLARLRDEVAIAGRLQHPHVVGVLGLWADGPGRWCLVTERVAGVSLERLGSPMSREAAAALGVELVSALRALHALGLAHGDVRPGNVLIGPGGARLFDVGTGRVVHPGQTAPEVVDGAPPGLAADVYGLGLVLAFATTGRWPFEGEGTADRLRAQRAATGRAPRRADGLTVLVASMLHPDPTRRPCDLPALERALRQLRASPERRVAPRRPMAPFRPGREWVVHGVDPATGARAVVRTDLSRRAARRLVAHLRTQGWRVSAHPEALGWRDVPMWLASAVVLGTVLPVVGAPIGFWAGMRWSSARTFPTLRRALPAASTPVPPRVLAAGTESAVMAAVLLWCASLAAWWQSPLLVLPLVGLGLLAFGSWRVRRVDPGRDAEQARVLAELASTRLRIERSDLDLDRSLSLGGEVHALEDGWREGSVDARGLLARLDAIGARLPAPVTVGVASDPSRHYPVEAGEGGRRA